jgi:hypothetical protein
MHEGNVDHITRHLVEGWAFNTADVTQSVDILIFLDGFAVSCVTADLPRPDVAAEKQLPSALHGFSAPIPQFLDTAVAHCIQVKFADTNQLIPNGERRFPPLDEYDAAASLAAVRETNLSPLFVTHMPRSGSTMCMALLHRHPYVLVAERYPFEVKPATYYARAARLLTEYADHDFSASPTEFTRSSLHLGFNPFNHMAFDSVFRDGRLRDHFFERSSRKALFDVLRSVAADYYRHLVADQTKYTARFFAEKCEAHGDTRQSIITLFPDAYEILLIRDPRDILCSTLSYFKESIEEDWLRNVQNGCEQIRQIANERRDRTLIVKYEALVFNQLPTLKTISQFLDTPDVDCVWSDGLVLDPNIFKEHATTGSPEESVGRWKADLSDSQKESCAIAFSKFLFEFGYEPTSNVIASKAARRKV